MIAQTTPLGFSRDRLYARFDTVGVAPVTLVVASAGSGKSTAIREYLALRRVDHVRFTGNAGHATAGEFLRGFGAAFAAVAPSLASSAAATAARLGQPGGEVGALAWAREHLSGLATTVVLDDLHHVLADPRSAGFISGLIDATAPRVRWILGARDATALPVPRWLADGVIDLPVEDADLRVELDELRAAARAAGLGLDEAALRAVYARTAGWPLGLAVALAGGGAGFESREQTYDRLVEAALAPLPAPERERLVELALVGAFDLDVLARLDYAPRDAEALLESGLVYALDRATYAFYDPYRERLARRVGAFDPARRGTLLDRAAGALEETDRWSEAVGLRIEAGDGERLATTLDARGFEALDHGDIALVERALGAVPETVLVRHARALGMKAALASLEERFDVSEAWFRMAVDAAADDGDRREIVIRYGVDLVRRGRTDVVTLLETEAARERSRSSADASLWGLLGTAYVEAHRLDDAREAARRALLSLGDVDDDGLRARIYHQAAYVALNDGDYAAARDLAERALTAAENVYLYDVAARILSVLFNIAILHDDDVPAGRRGAREARGGGPQGRQHHAAHLRAAQRLLDRGRRGRRRGDRAARRRAARPPGVPHRDGQRSAAAGPSAARGLGRPLRARLRAARAGRREAVRRGPHGAIAGPRSRSTRRRPAGARRARARSATAASCCAGSTPRSG